MERTLEEYLALIDETVAYYSENPKEKRALKEGNKACQYLTEKGQMCAVGRCLENVKDYLGCSDSYTQLYENEDGNIPFKPAYRGFSGSIWQSLQDLHDNHSYWEEDGISEKGETIVKELKKRITNKFNKDAKIQNN